MSEAAGAIGAAGVEGVLGTGNAALEGSVVPIGVGVDGGVTCATAPSPRSA
jgi:hypothetical protein